MDEKSEANRRKYDETEGEFENRPAIPKEPVLGDTPTIDEEQWWKEQQKEELGIEGNPEVGCECDSRAKRDLHKRGRDRTRRHAHEEAACHDGKKHDQNDADYGHWTSLCPTRLIARRSFWTGQRVILVGAS